jgi:DNA-binding NarL/FixJ family response regulator
MTARARVSIRLSADECRRLLAWGPDLASAVRRVLTISEAARVYADDASGSIDGDAHAWWVVESLLRDPWTLPTTRDRVRAGLAAGHSVADIARELKVTRQAVQWHAKRIREGA